MLPPDLTPEARAYATGRKLAQQAIARGIDIHSERREWARLAQRFPAVLGNPALSGYIQTLTEATYV